MKFFYLSFLCLWISTTSYAQNLGKFEDDMQRKIYSTNLFISSFSPLAMQGYVIYAGSDTLAANSTKTILLGSSTTIAFPLVCELENVNTAGTSIRIKSISNDRFVVTNADAVNAKDFIWWVFSKRP